VTLTHAAGDQIKAMDANVHKAWMLFSLLRLSCRNPNDVAPLCATSLRKSSPPNPENVRHQAYFGPLPSFIRVNRGKQSKKGLNAITPAIKFHSKRHGAGIGGTTVR
jgi:hypothetical protein